MIKCHRCGKEINLPYINPNDGIFTYCDFCWNQILGELDNENRKPFTDKTAESSK